jgi:hypothetical protein
LRFREPAELDTEMETLALSHPVLAPAFWVAEYLQEEPISP